MRTVVCVAIALISLSTWRAPMGQTLYPKTIAQFPGASLKWVNIAQPEFRTRGLDLDHYTVSIADDKDRVDVTLTSIDGSKQARGSSGTYPAFAVEIAKANGKVIRAYYMR